MTKTLILMRHAKSSWDDPLLSDHNRVLNERGRRSATALGDWLREQSLLPDEAWVSSAARTVETFERLAIPCPHHVTETLYHAGPEQMMSVLQRATGDIVLMVGHNPGIAELADRLVKHPPEHARFDDYPTGATLVATFDIQNWKDARWSSADALHFVIPRELLT
jgi:phosphohistidine phosphatase